MKRLNIHTLKSSGYYERDVILLHACFQILVDFIEKEKPHKITEDQISRGECEQEIWNLRRQKDDQDEAFDLYDWWVNRRSLRKDPIMKDGISSPPILFEPIEVNGVKYSKMIDNSKNPKYKDWYDVVKESARLEADIVEEDQRNLHKLIDIRSYLWTWRKIV